MGQLQLNMTKNSSKQTGTETDMCDKLAYPRLPGSSENLFQQLIRNFPEGSISIVDRKFRFVFAGGMLHEHLHAAGNLAGSMMYSEFPISVRKKIKNEVQRAFDGQVVTEYEFDVPELKHSYLMDAFPLREDDKSIFRVGIIIRNISKLKKAEENLIRALQVEKELNELKSRFVSTASHEFRTPLSTILSSTYLLSNYTKTEDQPKRDRHIERIVASVSSLTDMLNDFLSIGRIEEGKILQKPGEIDLPEFLNSINNELAPLLKPGQTMNFNQEGKKSVYLDRILLRHIVVNLLSNAIKFSPEHKPIEVKTSNYDTFTFSVSDHGIGIPFEDQKHLFERFYRGANVAHIQGTGLGLHIVRRYTEIMNGSISFHSEPEKGTTFILRFKNSDGHSVT